MGTIKFMDILKEESIQKIDKKQLVKKLKLSFMDIFPNTDLNNLLLKFYDNFPNSDSKKFFYNDTDPDVFDISDKQFLSIVYSPEMDKFLNDTLESESIKNVISQIKNDGKIEIYRSITVNKDWFDKLKNGEVKRLGIFWSWDAGYSAYGGKQEYEVELVSNIDEKYINWPQTIIQNIIYEDTENEITLFKNTPIELVKVKYKKKISESEYSDLNPKYFNNKMFYA